MTPVLTEVAVIDVVTATGIAFRVMLIRGGTTHPVNERRNSESDVVEFYDRRYPLIHPVAGGQFVGGYYVHTLLDRYTDLPLVLDDWITDWRVDVDTMALVTRWLRHQLERVP